MRALPGIAPARDTMPLAKAAAQKALELNPDMPEAQAVLGAIAGIYEYDWKESQRRYALASRSQATQWAQKAHALAPWHSRSTAIFAGLLLLTGERQRALELLDKLRPPQVYGIPSALSFYYMLTGELELAAHWSSKAIEQRDPRIVLGFGQPMSEVLRSDTRGVEILRSINLLNESDLSAALTLTAL